MKPLKKSSLLLFLVFALFSLQGTKNDNATVFNLKTLEKSLKYIPAGSMTSEDEPGYLVAKTSSFKSFYMYEHEVSNRDYLIFLSELKAKDPVFYTSMLPDTTVWQTKIYYCEPYVQYYFRHPAYRDYPVVGVTNKQAEAYCQWLTERYTKEGKRKFSKAEFRLPTSGEWEYAATGGLKNSYFPWEGPYLQNKKMQWMANFNVISQADIVKERLNVQQLDGTMKTEVYIFADPDKGPGVALASPVGNADVTTPALSYYPNAYGLYNMAGNVEEFVSEPGITHGGSFYDTGYYLQNRVTEQYDTAQSASFERGFRFVMVVE